MNNSSIGPNGSRVEAQHVENSVNTTELPANSGTGATQEELRTEIEDKKESAAKTEGPFFAIWIDAVGFDALAALGFLQELEKNKIKAVKVVGAGFGCYVALAWALENNGNQAEWQSLKWNSWDSLGSPSLFGKITSRVGFNGDEQNFRTEVDKLLPVKDFAQLKLPADCPLFERSPQKMVSAETLQIPLSQVLWFQFQVPALTKNAEEAPEKQWLSGVVGAQPLVSELESVTPKEFISGEKPFTGWIVLKTRNSKDRGGPAYWSEILSERSDIVQASGAQAKNSESLPLRVLSLDIGEGESRPTKEILLSQNRRRYLLNGRKRAQAIMRSEAWKNFFEGSP